MISKELIRKLRRIEIHTAKLANEQLAGSYHSIFKGRGMSFAEVRQYQPGDDVRFIDWNVSARMGEAYVKVFTEEREMTVMLLVDLSGSQDFGSGARSKRETVAELSALLAFSAIRNNDRVGLILFTDQVEVHVPPKKGKSHVMRVVTEILSAKPNGRGTDLSAALNTLGKVCKRRSVAFVISDFVAPEHERALRIASHRHDVIPIEIADAREEQLVDIGLALVEDLETGEVCEIDTSDKRVRKAYQRLVSEERAARLQLFGKLRLDHVRVDTNVDVVEPVATLFRRRQRRMRGYR